MRHPQSHQSWSLFMGYDLKQQYSKGPNDDVLCHSSRVDHKSLVFDATVQGFLAFKSSLFTLSTTAAAIKDPYKDTAYSKT